MITVTLNVTDPPSVKRSKLAKFWDFITTKIWGSVSDAHYDLARKSFNNLVAGTPVDTGWAQASWRASLDGSLVAMLPDPGGVAGAYADRVPTFDVPRKRSRNHNMVDYVITNDRKNIEVINSVSPHAGFVERALEQSVASVKFRINL